MDKLGLRFLTVSCWMCKNEWLDVLIKDPAGSGTAGQFTVQCIYGTFLRGSFCQMRSFLTVLPSFTFADNWSVNTLSLIFSIISHRGKFLHGSLCTTPPLTWPFDFTSINRGIKQGIHLFVFQMIVITPMYHFISLCPIRSMPKLRSSLCPQPSP